MAAPERLYFDDFSGGVSLIESPFTMPAPHLPSGGLNTTLRGRQLVSRFGTIKAGSLGSDGSVIYYSSLLDIFLGFEDGISLYRYTVSSSNQQLSGRTLVHTFTAGYDIGICDFLGKIVVVHPVDGVFLIGSGFSWTPVTSAVRGTSVAVWQNKLWVSGDPRYTSRVWWSAPGTAGLATWNTDIDFVDIRELNDFPITALGAGVGMDVDGRAGLYVFKSMSTYRIFQSETGQYTTVDGSRGPQGKEAIAYLGGYIYFANDYGIYRVAGDKVETISDPIRPAWDRTSTYGTPIAVWSAWDRVYFCKSDTDHPTHWEFIPEKAAWFPHRIANGLTGFDGIIAATSHRAKGLTATTPLNSAFLLLSDNTTVIMAPNHPAGATIENVPLVPGPMDVWDLDAESGTAFFADFALPTITLQGRRFTVQSYRVLGWNTDVGEEAPPVVYWAGGGEYATNAAASSFVTLPEWATVNEGSYASPGTPVGFYVALRPLLRTTMHGYATLFNDIMGGVVAFPAAGISAVEAILVPQE